MNIKRVVKVCIELFVESSEVLDLLMPLFCMVVCGLLVFALVLEHLGKIPFIIEYGFYFFWFDMLIMFLIKLYRRAHSE